METIGIGLAINADEHSAPAGHPERADKLDDVLDWLNTSPPQHIEIFSPTEHGTEPIYRVHERNYIDKLKANVLLLFLDSDTYVTPTSFKAVCDVVDLLLSAVDNSVSNKTNISFVIGRPPGHHAERAGGMGFCPVNSIAVAAQYALDSYPLGRVSIVDFDVHHGNGTQDIFYDRRDCFFASLHQYPFYPGTGAASERGIGVGLGYTLNCPLKAGSGDREVLDCFDIAIIPALEDYHSEMLFVSAGFDAHARDPIGGCAMSGDGFYQIGVRLKRFAAVFCNGRVICNLEGGYDKQANKESIENFLRGLSE
ncbi:MAG: histone deacetylase [candidate division Zixibacteria bacterium]|nr:histone deacetylase [candidate division Zixibacteria bacterium]